MNSAAHFQVWKYQRSTCGKYKLADACDFLVLRQSLANRFRPRDSRARSIATAFVTTFTSIVPTVTYCNLVWGTSSSSLMNELEHAHARAAKIIHRLPWKTPDQDVLTATGWEPLRNFYTKNVLKLMYKVQYNLTSDKIIGLFSPKTSSRAYNLRNTSSFISPRFNLDIGRTTLRYRGPLAWNLLPSSLKQAPSLNSFKQALKRTANTVNNIQFEKGACLIANKKADFIYY